ncbi:serine/threonine-protein kinase [Nonomuraea sp. NPDC046570]|uniref:serine/threonine-protein kinase n=1 Tax=Nonomuraea sp. NPDC046570 TaxID=3155255 RepID=UPI0033E0A5BB
MVPLRAEDPRRIGAYRLAGRLGQGGQGVVFLGTSPGGGQVAVKLLHAVDPKARRRFLGEVEAVRRVAPFCTAQVLDASLEGDRPYIVSEYVEGVSLREHVTVKGPRTGGSLDRLAIGTATALSAIHRAGVVHRDFKPGNVLLSLDGPRVIDFGISRLMDAAATTNVIPVGTPAYLSPEQIKGEPAGPPADLFAWALTVAYTATGRHAFRAETATEVLARILYGKPDLGPLDGPLRRLVEACLREEPGERPDAEEVLRRLLGQHGGGGDVLASGAMAAASDATEVAAPDSSEGSPAVRRRGRWKLAAALVAGVLAVVAAVALWRMSGGDGSPGLAGTWQGSAEHPTAKRVFPVEIRFQDAGGAMRWGADLHCSGRLTGTGSSLTFKLDRVTGEGCHPGTLSLDRATSSDQAAIRVTRSGDNVVTYTGMVARTS